MSIVSNEIGFSLPLPQEITFCDDERDNRCAGCRLVHELDELMRAAAAWREAAATHFAGLTPRERQIMGFILDGHPNKNIAADLGISQRTVENHRASLMRKTGQKSLPGLVRLAVAAA